MPRSGGRITGRSIEHNIRTSYNVDSVHTSIAGEAVGTPRNLRPPIAQRVLEANDVGNRRGKPSGFEGERMVAKSDLYIPEKTLRDGRDRRKKTMRANTRMDPTHSMGGPPRIGIARSGEREYLD
ncbi:hypothetical protein Trydic_g12521 [Trypoxylus dichotomus]